MTKLKAFADHKINAGQMMISVFNRVENIVGKGENAGNHHFFLFPQCFQKASFGGGGGGGVVKSQDCVCKGLSVAQMNRFVAERFENIVGKEESAGY